MEEGMEGGWREGWKTGWTEGWRNGWWEGYRKGGTKEGMEGGWMEDGMEGRGMEGGWAEGWTEGRIKGNRQGLRQGWMEAGTERGMDGGNEEGMEELGWREGWREGWKHGWRHNWKKRKGWMKGRRPGGTEEWREGWSEGIKEGSKEGRLQGGMVGIMDGGIEKWKDFDKLDIDELETEMEVIHSIKKMICHPSFESFCSKGSYESSGLHDLNNLKEYLSHVEKILPTTTFQVRSELDRQVVFDGLVSVARSAMEFMEESAPSSGKQFHRSQSYDFRVSWSTIFKDIFDICSRFLQWDNDRQERMDTILLIIGDLIRKSNKYRDSESRVALITKAFPALSELKESSEMLNFLLEVTDELYKPILGICRLCNESFPYSTDLIGPLLSFKQSHRDAWIRVQGDLEKVIKEEFCIIDLSNHFLAIFTYCFRDLPEFLQACFQYLACYPLGSDIPAIWLTKIWIAEGFIKPEKGESLEETASNYLEQLVRRSLVLVSKRSYSGSIKYYQINPFIYEFVIGSLHSEFLVVNPDLEEMGLKNRIAIRHNNKLKPVRSFLAFDLGRDVLGSATYLRVLELRNSAVRETTLRKLRDLQYLTLRGSNICMLSENIGNMKHLKTLDVRDPNIKTVPESIWNISSLGHVHVNPRFQIQGHPLQQIYQTYKS